MKFLSQERRKLYEPKKGTDIVTYRGALRVHWIIGNLHPKNEGPKSRYWKVKALYKMLLDRQTDLPTNGQMDMRSHLEVPLLIAKSQATAESTLAPKGRQCTLLRNLSRASFETLYQQKIYIIELLSGLVNFQNRSSMDQESLIFRSDT